MSKYIVTLRSWTPITETIEIEDGDDWDGRPVETEWDASDLAYDRVMETRNDLEWEVLNVDITE